MEGCTVGENVTLTGCILGKRSKIEGGGPKDEDKTRLTECEVQPGYVVKWGSMFSALSLFLSECLLTLPPQLKSKTKSSWCSKGWVRTMEIWTWMTKRWNPEMTTLRLHRITVGNRLDENAHEPSTFFSHTSKAIGLLTFLVVYTPGHPGFHIRPGTWRSGCGQRILEPLIDAFRLRSRMAISLSVLSKLPSSPSRLMANLSSRALSISPTERLATDPHLDSFQGEQMCSF